MISKKQVSVSRKNPSTTTIKDSGLPIEAVVEAQHLGYTYVKDLYDALLDPAHEFQGGVDLRLAGFSEGVSDIIESHLGEGLYNVPPAVKKVFGETWGANPNVQSVAGSPEALNGSGPDTQSVQTIHEETAAEAVVNMMKEAGSAVAKLFGR